jgi:alkylation response protein AidB-like acyl-CoA dehydrogenase
MAPVPEQSLASTEDQQLIRESALQFLDEQKPLAEHRALRDGEDPSGVSTRLWEEMSGLGWPGLLVPEEHGGAGLGFAELGVVFEALGRHAASTPLFSSGVLAASSLSLVGGWGDLEKGSDLATGACRAALALEESPRFSPGAIASFAEKTSDGYRLHGRKRPVLDATAADLWLVVARLGNAESEQVGLFCVDPSTRGVSATPLRWIDGRRAAELVFDGAPLPPAALLGEAMPISELVEPLVDRGATALSAELVGIMAAAFAGTLEYLDTREQFDQKLASFQALQHRAARMFTEIERSISLVQDALRALDERDPDASLAASAAKAHSSEVARHVTEEALQLFGGLGMTEEQDIGLYFKRARASSTLFGDAGFHYRRFATWSGF